ncbi:unnamed protein product [Meganyctiphanes norvegica]|uniref:Uncharacterized protein n=1 Tax=Meganyctiphanes norvegica TaxID=48144 RepID=A0AAV2S8G8_MEGNR
MPNHIYISLIHSISNMYCNVYIFITAITIFRIKGDICKLIRIFKNKEHIYSYHLWSAFCLYTYRYLLYLRNQTIYSVSTGFTQLFAYGRFRNYHLTSSWGNYFIMCRCETVLSDATGNIFTFT